MKKVSSVIFCLILALCMAIPYSAANTSLPVTTVHVYSLSEDVTVTRTITEYDSNARASTKSGAVNDVYEYRGEVVADITLNATFSYNGTSASVISASSDYTTYGSWSYGSESISKSRGTAKLSARLTKSLTSPVSVNMSLTCSPTGQLS